MSKVRSERFADRNLSVTTKILLIGTSRRGKAGSDEKGQKEKLAFQTLKPTSKEDKTLRRWVGVEKVERPYTYACNLPAVKGL